MTWFWLVIFYSFGGYLLEKGYAAAVRSPHRVRKCFLLLPLCPVYGLAMLAAGHLPPSCTEPFWRLVLYGGLTCTAVEYAVHFLYEKLLGVLFWDYSDTKLDLNRRICFPFAVVWGLLSAAVLRWVQPASSPRASSAAAGTLTSSARESSSASCAHRASAPAGLAGARCLRGISVEGEVECLFGEDFILRVRVADTHARAVGQQSDFMSQK